MIFQEKYFSLDDLLTDQILLTNCLYVVEVLGNIYTAIICFPVFDVIMFEIDPRKLIVEMNCFSLHDQKVKKKKMLS